MGTIAGLSDAGITSGLCAVGGGPMVAGVVVAGAVPLRPQQPLGNAVYRAWKWFS